MPHPLLPHVLSDVPRASNPLSCCRSFEAFHHTFRNSFCSPISPCFQLNVCVLSCCASRCRQSSDLGTPLRLTTMNVLYAGFLRCCPCTFLHRKVHTDPSLGILIVPAHLHSTAFTSNRDCFVERAFFPWFFAFRVCFDVFLHCWSVYDWFHVHQGEGRETLTSILLVHLSPLFDPVLVPGPFRR